MERGRPTRTWDFAFDGNSVVDTMENIKGASPAAWLAELPGDLERIARRCLARDPAVRYATMPALVRDLAHARRALPLVTPAELGAWLRAALA